MTYGHHHHENCPQCSAIREALEGMVYQFAYCSRGPQIHSGGLSSLEYAFQILDWPDPMPVPDRKCQTEGCDEEGTIGEPTPQGYQRVCHWHSQVISQKGIHNESI